MIACRFHGNKKDVSIINETGITQAQSKILFQQFITEKRFRINSNNDNFILTYGSLIGWGIMLQSGRSRDRIPMKSLDFSIDLSFQPHCGPGVDSASNRNEYREFSCWVKGRLARKADNLTAIFEPIFLKLWEPRRLSLHGMLQGPLPLGEINIRIWSSKLGVGREADDFAVKSK
jgi:hypothetical protein